MSVELERRFEERVGETAEQAGSLFRAVARKREPEKEQRGEDWETVGKIMLKNWMRRVVSYIRPEARFQV